MIDLSPVLANVPTDNQPDTSPRMTPLERRAGLSLAALFALRMLGLFIVLPVFALEAANYQGGNDPRWVGLALGAFGLTQALLQLPYGWASDRLGRKRMIVLGLIVFALGSLLAALATSIQMLAVGRAVQGAGAMSAAITALLADQTRVIVRTKAMAMIGISIAATFALSIVLSPWLVAKVGLPGIFALTAGLALLGIAVAVWVVPPEPHASQSPALVKVALQSIQPTPWGQVLFTPAMARLHVGVFVLHATQVAMWVALPALLVQAGLAKSDHWQLYLPAVLLSVLGLGLTFGLERRGHMRWVFMGAVALLLGVQLALMAAAGQASSVPLWMWGALILGFFTAFNALEALQPSQVSRLAPESARGAAMGVYNTLQSLGFFAGGAAGGLLMSTMGAGAVFGACAVALAGWLLMLIGAKQG